MVSAAARRPGGPLSDDAVHHHWEGYCSAAGLAFTVPGIERAGIHYGKAGQASAGVPGSSGCRPIGEQPDTPSGPSRARHRLHLAHHAGRMAQRQVMSAA